MVDELRDTSEFAKGRFLRGYAPYVLLEALELYAVALTALR